MAVNIASKVISDSGIQAVPIKITNLGPGDATNVIVNVTYPVSLTYSADSATHGTYVSGTKTWTVGTLTKDESATLSLTFTVDDGCDIPITVSWTVTSDNDPVGTNNTGSYVIGGASCCDIRDCININDVNGAVSGSGTAGDPWVIDGVSLQAGSGCSLSGTGTALDPWIITVP